MCTGIRTVASWHFKLTDSFVFLSNDAMEGDAFLVLFQEAYRNKIQLQNYNYRISTAICYFGCLALPLMRFYCEINK